MFARLRVVPVVSIALALLTAAPLPAAPLPVRVLQGSQTAATDSLTVRDLLDVSSTSVADLSADGRWLALTVTVRRDGLGIDFSRDGDPTYLRGTPAQLLVVDTRTLAQRPVLRAKAIVRGVTWSPDAARLAMLVVENGGLQVQLWERATGRVTTPRLPAGQYVAENSELRWTQDGRSLAFAARSEAWKARARARFEELTNGPITVLDGTEDFLEWDAMNRMNAERAVVAWDLATGAVRTLHPEGRIGQWTLASDGSAITTQQDITKKTDYDVIGGREFKLVTQSTNGGEARTLFATLRGTPLLWAEDGRRYVFTREGRVYLGSIADTVRRQLLGPTGPAAPARAAPGELAVAADTGAAARAQRARERFSAMRWSPAGDAILASNSEGIWLVDVSSGERQMIAALPDSTSRAPRPQVAAWSHDGRYVYFSENSRTEWDRAITRYDRQSGQKTELVRGARFFNGLRLSDDGSTAVLSVADGNRTPDVYVADGSLGSMRRVLEANPQLARKPLARTELISYLDADGDTRHGVLHYPVNYQRGTRYPTVFLIYETYFDDTFDAVANLLAARGYAVVKPSVGFEIGYPGEAWLKGVTAAANAVIQMGVADSARLGVHGTSYGGYATNLLITQTDRFKAAINISGKVDIISFYTDSPRLGVRNIHAAEKSQDRIGATLWQQPQKYVQHSAVMFADRIKTPLLLLTGGLDHNVPALNTREMYYALRRLGKPVVWANYVKGGHGVPMTTEAEFIDFHQRIIDWYGKYLSGKKGTSVTSEQGREE
ncbi:MAG TPA: prolyl oligopeptidase family serine peptidase [Gemmatimonadaceae bacterium]|nr:prolyl oligopeptidase family serine peptidase [Gemmatimonadaceae bacterium]